MRCGFVLCFLAFAAQCQAQKSFSDFMTTHMLSLRTLRKDLKTLRRTFDRNVEQITSFSENFRNATFTLTVNRFAILDDKDRRRLTSFRSSILGKVAHKVETVSMRSDTPCLPRELDWREYGAVTPVQDQGFYCGSCWAFSATGHLEGIISISTGEPAVKLSDQQFIDCNYNKLIGNFGCDGGQMSLALSYALKKDITTADTYPYADSRGECAYSKPQTRFNFSQPVMLPAGDEEALKVAVATSGPIAVAIDASRESFFYYSEGVYFDPNCTQWINHAVLVVGYGTDPVGGDYWLIKNSWSESWGMQGYMKLARNRDNHCGISKYAVHVKLI